MGAAVVFPDDRMPEGFPGTSHAHGQGQETEDYSIVGECLDDRLKASYSGIMVYVARMGQSDNGMHEDINLVPAGG